MAREGARAPGADVQPGGADSTGASPVTEAQLRPPTAPAFFNVNSVLVYV